MESRNLEKLQVIKRQSRKLKRTKPKKKELQEEEEVGFEGVQGEKNAVQEAPTGETEFREEDNVGGLFLQMRLTEFEGNRCSTPPRVSRDFNEQRL